MTGTSVTAGFFSGGAPFSLAERENEIGAMLDEAEPSDYPEMVNSISEGVLAQAGVYEEKAGGITQQIDALKKNRGDGSMGAGELDALILQRNALLRSMQGDFAAMDGLMERWHVRQQPVAHQTLSALERRYYNLEGNPLKYIPMYAFNFGNSICTLMVTMAVLSVLNTTLPHLHDSFPDTFNRVADPHAHWNREAFLHLFRQIGLFGLSFDFFYAGAKGLYARNTNATAARYWNGFMDTLGLGYRAVEPAVDVADNALHRVAPRMWEVISRYLYRGSRIGAIGIIRQLGRDLRMSFNDLATGIRRLFSKDARPIKPFGRIGETQVGLFIGGLFDLFVGIFENVMQNVIVKIPGNSIAGKVGLAFQDPVGLLAKNALPSAVCNVLHSNATARVSQYSGNDDMDVVASRFFLGAFYKGPLLTAAIATTAINSSSAHSVVLYLAAQVFIGGGSIMFSYLLTNKQAREWASLKVYSARERLAMLAAGIITSK